MVISLPLLINKNMLPSTKFAVFALLLTSAVQIDSSNVPPKRNPNILGKVINGGADSLARLYIQSVKEQKEAEAEYVAGPFELSMNESKESSYVLVHYNQAGAVAVESGTDSNDVFFPVVDESKESSTGLEAFFSDLNLEDGNDNNNNNDDNAVPAVSMPKDYKPVKGTARNVIRMFESVDYNKIREGLRRIKGEASAAYETIFKTLEASYMGYFDYSKVEADSARITRNKFTFTQFEPDNLIPGAAGGHWNEMSGFGSIEGVQTGLNERIREVLEEKVPKTMERFAYLSPKKTFEKDVLEGWLVDGLGLVYPNLPREIQKNDAISLILLAVILHPFKRPEFYEGTKDLMEELKRYNGEVYTHLPLDLFESPSIGCAESPEEAAAFQNQQLEKLFSVFDSTSSHFRFSRCVIAQLNQ